MYTVVMQCLKTFVVCCVLQVAIETRQTLFIDDPTTMPGLEKNEDYVKFGYGYYVGAPWIVGDTKGMDNGQ